MPKIYFTPGPSQLYPTVRQHLAEALQLDMMSISHREPAYNAMAEHTVAGLRMLLKIPADYEIFFLSSGTEAMERVIENTVQHTSFHFVDGDFSLRWQETSRDLHKQAVMYKVDHGQVFDYSQAHIPAEAELICLTHNETSSGVMLDLPEVYALKARHPEKLIALDVVSSAPYVDIDFAQLDVVFFSVQKGFGLPAGLCVLIVSPATLAKSEQIKNEVIQTYHSFTSLKQYSAKYQTPETPNVLDIFLLGKVCDDMLHKGLARIRQETEQKWAAIDQVVSNSAALNHFVSDPRYRSKTTIILTVQDGSKSLIRALADQNLIVGAGYKQFKDQQIRIANFPAHSPADFALLAQQLHVLTSA